MSYLMSYRMFCTLLTILFHDAGFVHSAPTADKILVQPGPLTVPPSQRSFGDPSWRLIDFGCRSGSTSATGGKSVIRGDAFLSLLLFEADRVEEVVGEDGKKEKAEGPR